MKEETKEKIIIIGIVCMVLSSGIYALVSVLIESQRWNAEYVTVEGKILGSYIATKPNGKLKHITITFNDGRWFKIIECTDRSCSSLDLDNIDLTVNSKIVLELYHFPDGDNPDNYRISRMIKIP